MSEYKAYYLHDPIGNIEKAITVFDKEYLQKAINEGMMIIGVTQDGLREIVRSVDDVVEPNVAVMEGFTLVLPSYVDSKVDELAGVVGELVDAISGQIGTASLLSVRKSLQRIHLEAERVIQSEASSLISKNEGVIY